MKNGEDTILHQVALLKVCVIVNSQSPQREVQTPVMASEAWQTSLQKLRADLVSCGLRALLLSAPLSDQQRKQEEGLEGTRGLRQGLCLPTGHRRTGLLRGGRALPSHRWYHGGQRGQGMEMLSSLSPFPPCVQN